MKNQKQSMLSYAKMRRICMWNQPWKICMLFPFMPHLFTGFSRAHCLPVFLVHFMTLLRFIVINHKLFQFMFIKLNNFKSYHSFFLNLHSQKFNCLPFFQLWHAVIFQGQSHQIELNEIFFNISPPYLSFSHHNNNIQQQ